LAIVKAVNLQRTSSRLMTLNQGESFRQRVVQFIT
jgi:hypothetical protein